MDKELKKGKLVSLEVADGVYQICQPLFDFFGVHGFTLQRMYKNGQRFYLSSSKDWINNFYEKNYFLASGFKKFNQLQTFNLWKEWPNKDDSFHCLMKDAEENFNYANGIVIIRSYPHYMDLITIRGYPNKDKINNLYLSEYESITKFIDYFFIKGAPLINKAKHMGSINIDENKIKNSSLTVENQVRDQKRKQFVKHIENEINLTPQTLFIEGLQLTSRETECVLYMIKGLVMKEIADTLKISIRTIETFIKIIKYKTGIHCKSALLKKIICNDINANLISRFLFKEEEK